MTVGRPDPLRILVVSNLLPPQIEGGAERVAWREMRGLASRGHDVRGLTVEWEDGKPHGDDGEEYAPIEVSRVVASSRRSRRPGNEFIANRHLWRAFDSVLKGFRPEVVHFHNLNGLPASLPGRARRSGTPVVATFHDGWGVCPKSFLLRPGNRICGGAESSACVPCLTEGRKPLSWRRRALVTLRNGRVRRALFSLNRLLFPSRHHLELYVRGGFPRERCRLLPNPIPEPTAVSAKTGAGSGEALQLLYLGSAPAHKGIDVLLDALAQLPPQTARLVIHGRLGSGEAERLERAVAERDLAPRVEHRGLLVASLVSRAMAACDVLVFPSRCVENSPLTILEAMAAGRPVVASRVGGIPELVRDGETGFTFPVGDASALAGRIRDIEDLSTRKRMGDNARAAVEDRKLGEHLTALENIYVELLDSS